MRKNGKWMGAAVLLFVIVWAGVALGQVLSAPAGGGLFEAATMSPYVTQPPSAGVPAEEPDGLTEGFYGLLPTPTPLAPGFHESGDMLSGIAGSILTVKAYDQDGALLMRSAGTVVFDNYTIAVTSNLLEGAIRLEAQSKAGYTYQITKVVAVEPHTGFALLEFQSPTDLKPLLPGDAVMKEGSLVDLIGQDETEGFFWKEGKVSAFAKEGASLIQCSLDVPGGFFGGALLNKLGEIVGLPYSYKEDAKLCYALDIGDLQALFVKCKGLSRTLIGEWTGKAAGEAAGEEGTAAPLNLTAAAADTGIALAWEAAPGAVRYYVYRAQGEDGAYYQLGYVYDPAYTDTDARAGETYTYTVRAVYPARMSADSNPAEAAVPDLYTEPQVPVQIGGSAFLNVESGMPSIDMRVENASRTKTVTGFSIAIFMKDKQEEYILKDDGTEYYVYFDVGASIEPLGGAYTGPLYLNGFSNVKYINVAITGVRTLDGAEIAVPKEDWAYSYWTVE